VGRPASSACEFRCHAAIYSGCVTNSAVSRNLAESESKRPLETSI
jgi:hypothetical protein